MIKLRKSWMALVMGALLVGTLVGVVWARPQGRPQAADITRKVTLSAGEFIVRADGYNWFSSGTYVECSTGACMFFAPVVFPCLPSVTVERIKLHVEDGNSGAFARATLHRLNLNNGTRVELGRAESVGTGGYQPWSSGAINKVVWPSQRAYIWLWIGGSNIQVGGVTVEYHRNL